MSFQVIVNGPMYKLFIQGLATVATNPIITYGPQKITCNSITPAGDLMVSGLIPPIKTDLQQPVSLVTNVDAELEIIAEQEMPEELVLQWGEGELLAYPNLEEADVPEEVDIFKLSSKETQENHPEAPRINYPLRFSINHDVLKAAVSKLKPSKGIILSYEAGPFYLATESWSDKVEIPGSDISFGKLQKGSYSSLIDREVFESVINALELYESVSLALGEDLPLIVVGIDPGLKLGYMIAQQV